LQQWFVRTSSQCYLAFILGYRGGARTGGLSGSTGAGGSESAQAETRGDRGGIGRDPGGEGFQHGRRHGRPKPRKRNLLAAETSSLADVLDLEAFHQARTDVTEDHKEARTAFVEKRKPRLQGR